MLRQIVMLGLIMSISTAFSPANSGAALLGRRSVRTPCASRAAAVHMAGGFGKAAPKKKYTSPKAAAREYDKLCEAGAISTKVYVRPAGDTDSEWLLAGAVAVGEGFTLIQAAHRQRQLVFSHATKISTRLAGKLATKQADLELALAAAGSIFPVKKPAEKPDDLVCGFRGDAEQFLTFEPATKT